MRQHRLLQPRAGRRCQPHRIRDDQQRRLRLGDERVDGGDERARIDVIVIGAGRDDVAGAAAVVEKQPQTIEEQEWCVSAGHEIVPTLVRERPNQWAGGCGGCRGGDAEL
jgi:hypothetical protein